jgi:hypothetical protein
MIEKGIKLEYRVLRLFLARGQFAERNLFPAVGEGYDKTATDVDVLCTQYGPGFHATRLHVECKSGKNVSKLDRVLWLAGVQRVIRADASYLVVPEIEADVAAFARSLDILVISDQQLETWEASVGLAQGYWIGRSNFEIYESAAADWAAAQAANKGKDDDWNLVKDTNRFLRYDSWLTFSYANRLLRLAQSLANSYARSSDDAKSLCMRYLLASLYVRFCQMLIEICADLLTIPNTQIETYLHDRFTFGDGDAKGSAVIIGKTLDWVQQLLAAKGISMPAELDAARLTAPPNYAADFVKLIELVQSRAVDSSNLAIAAEVSMFALLERENWPDALRQAHASGAHLAANAKGFFLRSIGLPMTVFEGLELALQSKYQPDRAITPVKSDPELSPDSPRVLSAQLGLEAPPTPPLQKLEEPQSSPEQPPLNTGCASPDGSFCGKANSLTMLQIDDAYTYLAIKDARGHILGEAKEERFKAFETIRTVNQNRGSFGTFDLTIEQTQQLLKTYKFKRMTENEKLQIATDWVDSLLRKLASSSSYTIGGQIVWVRKPQTRQHEFTVNLNGTKRMVLTQTDVLLQLPSDEDARAALEKRLEDELFARAVRRAN